MCIPKLLALLSPSFVLFHKKLSTAFVIIATSLDRKKVQNNLRKGKILLASTLVPLCLGIVTRILAFPDPKLSIYLLFLSFDKLVTPVAESSVIGKFTDKDIPSNK